MAPRESDKGASLGMFWACSPEKLGPLMYIYATMMIMEWRVILVQSLTLISARRRDRETERQRGGRGPLTLMMTESSIIHNQRA